jgi:hypothetical protein
MPQGTRELFPDGLKYGHAIEAISKFHAPVSHQFFQGVGMELMFKESQVMMALLLALKDLGEVALPMHDGILVPRSSLARSKGTMETVFKEQTGIDAVVRVEHE